MPGYQGWLHRGALAGLVAGLSGAAFQATVTERTLGRAIAVEQHHGSHLSGEPMVSRAVQQVGGALTTVVVGLLFGIVFATLLQLARSRLGPDRLTAALTLSGLCFVAFGLLPAILTPAFPPGVGDPATVGHRSTVYFLILALGALWVAGTLALPAALARVDRVSRHVPVVTVGVASLAALLLLILAPGVDGTVPHRYPGDLLWDFRVASLGQTVVMAVALPLAWSALSHDGGRERRDVARAVRK